MNRSTGQQLALSGLFTVLGLASLYLLLLQPFQLQMAPDTRIPILNTERYVELKEFAGRPIMVTFWATSCVSCMQEIPHLTTLYQEFAPRGFELIAIAMSYDRPDFILDVQKQMNIPYLISYDATGQLAAAFGGVRATPISFLINPKGEIEQQYLGKMDMAKLHKNIASMLEP